MVKLFNQCFIVLMFTYCLGLLWYRLSDYILPTFFPDNNQSTFVIEFGLRRPTCERDLGGEMSVTNRLVRSMYFMMTTLSTVGYGDFYPISSSEKIIGSLIQVIGVTLFALVMNVFIDIVLNVRDQDVSSEGEKRLNKWFALIKHIRFQPFGEGKDIDSKLKLQIEEHFKHYWKNDRTAVLVSQKDYFDSIPFKI